MPPFLYPLFFFYYFAPPRPFFKMKPCEGIIMSSQLLYTRVEATSVLPSILQYRLSFDVGMGSIQRLNVVTDSTQIMPSCHALKLLEENTGYSVY